MFDEKPEKSNIECPNLKLDKFKSINFAEKQKTIWKHFRPQSPSFAKLKLNSFTFTHINRVEMEYTCKYSNPSFQGVVRFAYLGLYIEYKHWIS